jgi:hypothetical protein
MSRWAQLLLGVAVVTWRARSLPSALLWSGAWLYLVPPVVCRVTLLLFGQPQGRGLTQDTRAYKVWWFTHQWQVVFNRLPWLEELLRLVPGLYGPLDSARGVGGSAPGPTGDGVAGRRSVSGRRGSRRRDRHGRGADRSHRIPVRGRTFLVDVAAPRVGRGAMMGARSGLGPGAELAPQQVLPAGRMMPPFVRWDGTAMRASRDGRRRRRCLTARTGESSGTTAALAIPVPLNMAIGAGRDLRGARAVSGSRATRRTGRPPGRRGRLRRGEQHGLLASSTSACISASIRRAESTTARESSLPLSSHAFTIQRVSHFGPPSPQPDRPRAVRLLPAAPVALAEDPTGSTAS